MAILLSIETSTSTSSVALHGDGVLISQEVNAIPQSTASQLAVMIQRLLKQSQIQPNELSGLVVTSGPGSYTGLRIGVATAKGLCYALSIPLIAVNSLELMTRNAREVNLENETDWFCPMLDARRMEVYCLLINQAGETIQSTHARVIDHNSFASELKENKILFFGDGAEKCKQVIQSPQALFLDGIHPTAEFLGYLGYVRWTNQQFENLGDFEPFYLKDFLIKKPNSVQ